MFLFFILFFAALLFVVAFMAAKKLQYTTHPVLIGNDRERERRGGEGTLTFRYHFIHATHTEIASFPCEFDTTAVVGKVCVRVSENKYFHTAAAENCVCSLISC